MLDEEIIRSSCELLWHEVKEDEYRNKLRMDNSTFLLLLENVDPLILKKKIPSCVNLPVQNNAL